MMKLKLSQLLDAKEPLSRMSRERFPSNLAYRIQRNIKHIQPELTSYEKTLEAMAKERYEAVETEPGLLQVPDKNLKEFVAERDALLAEEVELPIMQINLNEFPREITPSDLGNLEWMFILPEEPAAPKAARKRHDKAGQE